MIGRPKFVLASGSPRRLTLINQAGIEPDALRPADIDEVPKRGELPRACANRLARAKAEVVLAAAREDPELQGAYILAADTVVAVGRRILPKAELLDEAAQCLRLLSGRNHRVYTAICLVTPNEGFRQRLLSSSSIWIESEFGSAANSCTYFPKISVWVPVRSKRTALPSIQ